jgi:hypothetical protein
VKGHGNTEARSVPIYVQQVANAVRANMIDKMKVMIDDANEKMAALDAKQAETASENASVSAGDTAQPTAVTEA